MYKIIYNEELKKNIGVRRSVDGATIPFDPANTDYQTFKTQINAQVATLQDADGNAMSADEAIAFVSTLP